MKNNNKKLIKNIKSLSPSPCSKRFKIKTKQKRKASKLQPLTYSGLGSGHPQGYKRLSRNLRIWPSWVSRALCRPWNFPSLVHSCLPCHPNLGPFRYISRCKSRILLDPKLKSEVSSGGFPALLSPAYPQRPPVFPLPPFLLPLLVFSSPLYFLKYLGASEKAQLRKVFAPSLSI